MKTAEELWDDDFVSFERDDADEPVVLDKPAPKTGVRKYMLAGVEVRFPFEAYQNQLDMMEKIITALNGQRQHALLESPTGTGKSLALLCGVMAWIEAQKRGKRTIAPISSDDDELAKDGELFIHDTVGASKKRGVGEHGGHASKSGKPEANSQSSQASSQADGRRVPRIFIASRTHRQLAQLVKELRRTGYAPAFTVLASRNYYCINDAVKKEADINEACKKALKPEKNEARCKFANGVKAVIGNGSGYTTNMDVEELVKHGLKRKACPYFLAREAKDAAEIVFAPYNYLVDPNIRSSMGIDLKDAIVIIDEAHNIEDACRAAGGFEGSHAKFSSIQGEMTALLNGAMGAVALPEAHKTQAHVAGILANWMLHGHERSTHKTKTVKEFEKVIDIWEGESLVAELKDIGLTYQTLLEWSAQLAQIVKKSNESVPAEQRAADAETDREHTASASTCMAMEALYRTLRSVLDEGKTHLSAYRMARSEEHLQQPGHKAGKVKEVRLAFWCLSPAVVFGPMVADLRAVVLTSGTLSPMDVMASELSVSFAHRLESLHIIEDSQIWVGGVSTGPNGAQLLGVYRNMETLDYQDGIIQSIVKIAEAVPYGVLCFLPSYSFLNKLVKRMKLTSVYERLEQIKHVFIEPREGGLGAFESVIASYYNQIKACQKTKPTPRHPQTGAIFFAVYRGKVSEGLDFIDDNARAVIAVGIPYPALHDQPVVLKKEYNDRNGKERRLLNGNQWYEAQAFRAMNQALGRCIRHRHDWGAVILLDHRFTQHRTILNLSKWIRKDVKACPTFQDALQGLTTFISARRK